jgi:lipopolysaccharide export system protein LptA
LIQRVSAAALVAAMFCAWAAPASAQAPSGQVLPGGKSNQPVNISATKLDYFDKDQKLIYTGDVLAIQGDSRLKASTLVIYLMPKEEGEASGPSGNAQVRRMEASGPVTLTSKDQVGTGNSGVYEKGANTVTLIGNVTLTQGPNVTTGDRLVYDLTTKKAIVQGNVISAFVPKNGNGSTAGTAASATSKPKSPANKPDRQHAKDQH